MTELPRAVEIEPHTHSRCPGETKSDRRWGDLLNLLGVGNWWLVLILVVLVVQLGFSIVHEVRYRNAREELRRTLDSVPPKFPLEKLRD